MNVKIAWGLNMTTGLINVVLTDVFVKGNNVFNAYLNLDNGAILMSESTTGISESNEIMNSEDYVFSHIRVERDSGEFKNFPYICDLIEIDGHDFISKEDLQYIKERI